MTALYDAFAREFSQTRQKMWWNEFSLLFPLVEKTDRILDLGCGNGRLRKFLTSEMLLDGNYFGMDASRELLEIARQDFPRDHFFLGDFTKKFPFGGQNFEVIAAIASFHHLLSPKDQLRFLTECSRVLKPNGMLFLTSWNVPQKYFWKNFLTFHWKNWRVPFGRDHHERIYRRTSIKELTNILKKSGFDVLRCELFENRNFVAIARLKK